MAEGNRQSNTGVHNLNGFLKLMRHRSLPRWVMAVGLALLVMPWMVAPVAADTVFLGVLTGTPPLSPPFVNSPHYYNISSGPVTVVFTTKVENLTNRRVSVMVDINVNHVMTYYGQNVADGQPGKAGITFKPGDVSNTRQVTYGTPFQRLLTVAPKGAPPQLVTFSTVMRQCGYFQFDIGKHMSNGRHDNLSAGFARVLGCKTGTGGTGGVSAASANGEVLADTGFPAAGVPVGALMVLIGGVGMWIRRR